MYWGLGIGNKRLMKIKILTVLLSSTCLSLVAADDAWESQRKQILDRPREVFYNTDGDDAICFGHHGHTKEATPENFNAEAANVNGDVDGEDNPNITISDAVTVVNMVME